MSCASVPDEPFHGSLRISGTVMTARSASAGTSITVRSVSATTSAVRGLPVKAAISPKKSPTSIVESPR